MRIFKTKWMARFARKAGIDDAVFVEAIERAEKGLIDADLGGGLIKQRVGRPGQGKSGGYRTIIAIRFGDRAFVLFAFAKNELDNISQDNLRSLRDVADKWFATSPLDIEQAIEAGEIKEILNV